MPRASRRRWSRPPGRRRPRSARWPGARRGVARRVPTTAIAQSSAGESSPRTYSTGGGSAISRSALGYAGSSRIMTETPACWSRCHSASGSSVPRSVPSDSTARRSSPAAARSSSRGVPGGLGAPEPLEQAVEAGRADLLDHRQQHPVDPLVDARRHAAPELTGRSSRRESRRF